MTLKRNSDVKPTPAFDRSNLPRPVGLAGAIGTATTRTDRRPWPRGALALEKLPFYNNLADDWPSRWRHDACSRG
jgi:hypothetical protein